MDIKQILEDTFYNRPEVQDLYFIINDMKELLKGDMKAKAISMCLQKEFKLVAHKMLRKNSFTNEERNTKYFHIKRSDLHDTPDTTADLDGIFDI